MSLPNHHGAPTFRPMRVCAILGLLAASLGAVDPGDPMAAQTLLQINDAHWIEREAARFAASLGHDPAPIRRRLAETLYRNRSLDGIDVLRPAMLWWRTDNSSLTALIPLKDRRIFCDGFGFEQPPMVRVGERDGTVVYTQNLPTGLREYRLLAVDEVAVVARNVEDVHRLVPRIPDLLATDPNQPALRLVLRGEALRQALVPPVWLPLPRLPVSGLDLRPALNALGPWIARESASLTIEVRSLDATQARLSVILKARPDGELATWLASQQNQPTRIAGLIESPTTALVGTTRMAWNGRLEDLANTLGPSQRASVGPAWTPTVEESWRQVWRLAERIGEIAFALEENPEGGLTVIGISEQPRATEQAVHLNALAAAATGDPGRSSDVDGTTVVTRTIYGRTEASAAGARHIVSVSTSGSAGAEAGATAARLAVNAAQVVPPRGTPALMTLRADLGRLVRMVPGANRESEAVKCPITALVTTKPGGVLQLDVTIPLEATAGALGKLPTGWW